MCPMCFSPIHVKKKELHAVSPLVCTSPVISFLNRTTSLGDSESGTLTSEDFRDSIGNISLGLSDEHGNELDLECSIHKLKELTKIRWEQVSQLLLVANLTFSVDVQCCVDREKYEQLWRLVAYYSNVPAHLKRGDTLSTDPYPVYAYKQDSVKDAQYYTGLKVKMLSQSAWLMQASIELQLNRPDSSTRMVNLILRTNVSETVDTELQQRLKRTWVMIESKNRTQKAMSVILGSPIEMFCNVHSSVQPVVQWMLPDGSKLNSPFGSPEDRVSVSSEGRLKIKGVTHRETGVYYCIAKVHGDLAVLSFYLSVQESSSPPPGEDKSITSMEEFAGSPISLDCTAYGSPDAEINWILPSSRIVHFQANSSKPLVYLNGTLHIPQAQVSDSGYYKCVAINQHGKDTLVKKVSIVRRNGLIRPVRKFPARPQSASGVNTQIQIPTENIEEASGDNDRSTMRLRISSVRRKIPGRRGIHPSRSTLQRRPVLRKPTGAHTENQKSLVEKRRRNNLSKSKIDPLKWANILAKIRDRNTVTSPPVSFPTKMTATLLMTKSKETPDELSDGMTVREGVGHHSSIFHSPQKPTKYSSQGKTDHVTPESYTIYSTHDAIANSRHVSTDPYPTQSAYPAQHTTHDSGLNLITSSNSGFFLPQTTSVPLQAITVRPPGAHTASSSTIYFPENQSTTIIADKIQTADLSEGLQIFESQNKPNDATSSTNHREPFFMESQTTSSASPVHSAASQEGSGNYWSETSNVSQFQPHPKNTALNEFSSQAVTTGSPTTASSLTARRKMDSTRRPKSDLPKVNHKRRNGARKRRPNKKKQNLKTPRNFITTTPVNTPMPSTKPSASKELNTEGSGNAVSLGTTVPFTESQVASSGRLSHKESTDFRQNHKALNAPFSLPASSFETKDNHLVMPKQIGQSTSAAPLFSKVSPDLSNGNTTPYSMPGILANKFPAEMSETLSTNPQPRFADSPTPPGKHLEDRHKTSFTTEPTPFMHSKNSSWGFQAATQLPTDIKNQQFVHKQTLLEEVEKMHLEKIEIHSLQPPHFTPTASSFQGRNKAVFGEIPSGLPSTPRMLFEVSTEKPTLSEDLNHSSNQNEMLKFDSKLKENQKKPLNGGVDVLPISDLKTTHPSATSTLPYRFTLSRETPHPSKPTISPSLPPTESLPMPTSQYATFTVSKTQNQQIKPITTTSDTRSSMNFHPTTVPTNHKIANTSPTSQTSTSIPIITVVLSKPSQKTLSADPLDASTQHLLPERGSSQRGKPRITMTHSQTITVKAETDAKLPCETEGQPMPFLSWTKVSSGM